MSHLTVEQCRKALPPNCDFTDTEIETLRNLLYTAALSGIELFERFPTLLGEEFGPGDIWD